jgi:ribose 5-phosphate isomerase A
MKWNNHLLDQLIAGTQIKNKEQKQSAAEKMAGRVQNGDVIGAGSGSTSLMAIQSISRRVASERLEVKFIPTSSEINYACQHYNLVVTDLLKDKPDWCFDGADEVDMVSNLNKGRGGALYKEKLIMSSCDERYILIDPSKKVERLGTNFPIPIEIHPSSISYVTSELLKIGSESLNVRLAGGKDGPVFTENGCLILDVYFNDVYSGLEKDIKAITGVLESGLFQGYNPILVTS